MALTVKTISRLQILHSKSSGRHDDSSIHLYLNSQCCENITLAKTSLRVAGCVCVYIYSVCVHIHIHGYIHIYM